MKEATMICDRNGNELYFTFDTVGACQRWCIENNIDGSNDEYIAEGTYDEENKEFNAYNYTTIDNDAWRD